MKFYIGADCVVLQGKQRGDIEREDTQDDPATPIDIRSMKEVKVVIEPFPTKRLDEESKPARSLKGCVSSLTI